MNDKISENQFWLIIWAILLVAFLALVISITWYSIDKNERIATAKDPVATKCAIGGDYSATQCVAYVAAIVNTPIFVNKQ